VSRQKRPQEIALTVFFMAALFAATTAAAQVETVLHSFAGTFTDGSYPLSNLIVDKAGNLYGTTVGGGPAGLGTVFELSPQAGGGWKVKILHSFNNGSSDGYSPYAGLILDASGNLYGATSAGGSGDCGIDVGCGTVFEVTQVGGAWRERILYNFKGNGVDGYGPLGGVIFDGSGKLYGVTNFGGVYSQGVVFELTPKAGEWGEHLLHTFHHDGRKNLDGANPVPGLVSDASGNLYGTTTDGGAYGYGTVFEMVRGAEGIWTEKILYSFNNHLTDGLVPDAGVVFDSSGNLYGTNVGGGRYAEGTVFELVSQSGGNWSEAILHNFSADGTDGFPPEGGVIFDTSGSLFGTTVNGGSGSNPSGTIYKLTPSSGGTWTEDILFNFSGSSGSSPGASLVFDASGNVYGTTQGGGAYDAGTVFELTP
jgi:uncharacterized repeat protein (TIGR03803 family)